MMKRIAEALLALAIFHNLAHAQLDEGFDNVFPLTPPSTEGLILSGGWIGVLRSDPLGPVGIFQGVPPGGPQGGPFVAHSGADDSWIGVSFANAGSFTASDVISTWILSPEVDLQNGQLLRFYTRTVPGSTLPDHLEVRLSTNGNSTEVGNGAFTVGDFGTSLLSINPGLQQGGYPEEWTMFEVEITGLSGATTGRFAFHYFVTNLAINGNVIGIDTLTFTSGGSCLPGDVNGDGSVSLLDVSPFVDLLVSGDYQCEADINSDDTVDLLDVSPFVELLTGG